MGYARLREISVDQVAEAVKRLCMGSNVKMPAELSYAIEQALEREKSPAGSKILKQILENHRTAAGENIPARQDTGITLVFLKTGQDVHLVAPTGARIKGNDRQG
ncbi:MAG: fumarate hydratase [Firmicutes bacterium]|nr:fumarate hydratase [Candidatus Fermentithermobacillaceae bacterium]